MRTPRDNNAAKAKETRKLLGPRYPLSAMPKIGLERYTRAGGALRKRVKLGSNHPTKDSPS